MKRVLIIGSPGTGKTTFAKKLAKKTGLPLVHLDLYYHDSTKDYYQETNKQAWYVKVGELINKDKWIIDGNYNSTLENRIKRADTIIFFDFSTLKALKGILKRRIELHNKARDDMPSGWNEHIDWGFVHYVWRYNKIKRPKVVEVINSSQPKSVVVFSSHLDTEEYLNNLDSNT